MNDQWIPVGDEQENDELTPFDDVIEVDTLLNLFEYDIDWLCASLNLEYEGSNDDEDTIRFGVYDKPLSDRDAQIVADLKLEYSDGELYAYLDNRPSLSDGDRQEIFRMLLNINRLSGLQVEFQLYDYTNPPASTEELIVWLRDVLWGKV